MADKADIANDLMELNLEAALRNQRQATPVTAANDPDCEECGTEIPAARRAALPHCTTCVDCQQLLELRKKAQGI